MRRLLLIFLILLSFVGNAQFGSEMFIGRKANPLPAAAFNPVFVNGQSTSASGTNTVVLPGLSLTAGNTIIVAFRYGWNGVSTATGVTDNAGNTYTNAMVLGTTNNIDHFEIWYKVNALGNASNVVTVTFGVGYSPANFWGGSVQYSGITAVDVNANGTQAGSATSVTTGSFTTGTANTIGIFAGTVNATGDAITATIAGAAATQRSQDAQQVLTFFDKQFSSIQTGQTATMTSNNARSWDAGVIFLK